MKITKEQIRKAEKSVERSIRIEQGNYSPSVVHKTSKVDLSDEIADQEIEEGMNEYYEDLYACYD